MREQLVEAGRTNCLLGCGGKCAGSRRFRRPSLWERSVIGDGMTSVGASLLESLP